MKARRCWVCKYRINDSLDIDWNERFFHATADYGSPIIGPVCDMHIKYYQDRVMKQRGPVETAPFQYELFDN